jgi:hypothetical protein
VTGSVFGIPLDCGSNQSIDVTFDNAGVGNLSFFDFNAPLSPAGTCTVDGALTASDDANASDGFDIDVTQ